MLLSYNELCDLVRYGVIDADPKFINGASIDIRIGRELLVEKKGQFTRTIDLSDKSSDLSMSRIFMEDEGFTLFPGQFCLAHSVEAFHLPDDIACEFRLRSSIARRGLNALLAMWCLTGDTRIPLLDGRTVELSDLVGHQVWLYAVNDQGRTVPGFASRIWMTREVDELAIVILDDGSVVRCTPDHLWRTRNGQWIAAKDLRPGTPMMVITRRQDAYNGTHEQVYSPHGFRRHWVPTHIMVDRELNGSIPKGHVVHHIDHNPYNNHPENLLRMTAQDHNQLHHKELSDERRQKLSHFRSEKVKSQNEKRWSSNAERNKMSMWAKEADAARSLKTFIREHKDVWTITGQVNREVQKLVQRGLPVTPDNYLAVKRQNSPTLGKIETVFGSFDHAIQATEYHNHCVVDVRQLRLDRPMPVYDMTVNTHHCFVLDNGLVSHNCDPGWHGSQLTLELHNVLQYHSVLLRPNLRIGQMIFYRCETVPKERSYATVGRYNHQSGVVSSKGA